jgi:hypothetical protein
MEYDRDCLRLQILEQINRCFNKDNGTYLNELDHCIYALYKGKESNGLRHAYLEALFSMIAEGLVMPHVRVNSEIGEIRWQSFGLTEYGRKILEAKGDHPYFVSEYLSRITQILPMGSVLDSVIEFYVKESVELNRIGRYTPSVVMLGVASERAVDLLCEAVLESLAHDSREKFRKVVDGRNMKVKVDELCKKIDAVTLPSNLKDGIDHILRGFVTILRKHRNDFGHPSAVVATKDDALSYLLCFPQYLKRIYMLIEYYQNNNHQNEKVSP